MSGRKSKSGIQREWDAWHSAELQNCRDLPKYDKNITEADVPWCIRLQNFEYNKLWSKFKRRRGWAPPKVMKLKSNYPSRRRRTTTKRRRYTRTKRRYTRTKRRYTRRKRK